MFTVHIRSHLFRDNTATLSVSASVLKVIFTSSRCARIHLLYKLRQKNTAEQHANSNRPRKATYLLHR